MENLKVVKTLNGELIEDRKRPLRTTLYGEGVFETFRYNGRFPKSITKHYERLVRGAELLSVPKISQEDYIYFVEKSLDIAEENNLGNDLYIKTVLLSEGEDYYPLKPYKSYLLTIVKPYKGQKKEIVLTVSPYKVNSSNPLLRFKTTNYMLNILAKRYAIEKGCDDAILLNENDEITETTSANIFWVKENTLYTPALECGLVEGITRGKIIKNAKEIGWKVEEGKYSLKDLLDADNIFVSNSLNGIIKVKKIDIMQSIS